MHLCFKHHVPFSFAPDHIYLMVLQGLAMHESQTGLVGSTFELKRGRKSDICFRVGLEPGRTTKKQWESIFPLFAKEVRTHLPREKSGLLLEKFSTTKTLESVTLSVALNDVFQEYFNYSLTTLCGIPSIEIKGERSDWVSIWNNLKKLEQLGDLKLSWWFSSLIPIIKEIVEVYDGKINVDFWKSIYKFRSRSGGDHASGWICLFFPYVISSCRSKRYGIEKNKYVKWEESRRLFQKDSKDVSEEYCHWQSSCKMPPEFFHSGISSIPFHWKFELLPFEDLKCRFMCGFLGCMRRGNCNRIAPSLGWCILSKKCPKEKQ